ncbi:OLC1v1001046C1 [Oldenlandia corymbosa var. corymbosa]|uniref:OLC1v1001046C1 n=1 Tax=Oldenlandia corymbosa var. corymbosa TaxID=529605 RepID=A0AAV1D573_OLDCO|nr:OLC1v1001046C1 [Oldenlandia corymbosa var. corymbosa]
MAGVPHPNATVAISTRPSRTFATFFAKALATYPPQDISNPPINPKKVSFFNGTPELEYDDEEFEELIAPHKVNLVGKFSYGRPKIDVLREEFKKIGFKGSYLLGLMNPRHVLIRFELEEDYQRCWITSLWTICGYQMRILKWQPGFKFEEDPPIVPIWVSLHELPFEWTHPRVLFSIASAVGKPLQVDTPTLNLTRPSVAHFCAEVDLTKKLPKSIRIGKKGKKYEQYYTYEYVPSYCSACCKIGHRDVDCRKKKVNWGLKKGERKTDLEVEIISEDPFIVKAPHDSGSKMVDDNVLAVTEAQVDGDSRLRSNAQGDFVSLRESTQLASPEARVADALRLDTDTQGEVGSLAQTTQLVVLSDDVLNDCSEMNKTAPVMQANKFVILQSCDDNRDAIADIVQENADEDSDDVENVFMKVIPANQLVLMENVDTKNVANDGQDPKRFYPDDSFVADLLVSDDGDDAYEES